MGAELPRPGVEVIQVFRSTSPTVVTPTLVPCVVGVCRQVVDVLVASAGGGSVLNSDALVPIPAQLVAAPAGGGHYTGLDGLKLVVSIDNNPPVTTTFSGVSLTPAQVVQEILAAFTAAGVTAATAEALTATANWRMHTVASGQFESIQVLTGVSGTDPAVLSAFGFGARTAYGHDGYDQHGLTISQASFPNPRNNLTQLAIENASIRAFLYLGGTTPTLKELLQTQAFLRRGDATGAVATFTGDLTVGATITALNTQTLSLVINGGTALVTTFAAPANAAAVVAQVNAVLGAVATASLDATGKFLVITTTALGLAGTIGIPTGTAVGLGFPVASATGVTAARAIDSGNGTAVTSLIQFPGANLTASATAAAYVGSIAVPGGGVPDGQTLVLDDGLSVQTVTFLAATTPALVLTQINAVMDASAGGQMHASLSVGNLSLASTVLGLDGQVKVVSGTAMATLGLVPTTVYGTPFPVAAGDSLYLDGVLYATVSQVAPGGAVDTVKINKQVPIAADIAKSRYFIANNLTVAATFGVSRPDPNLQIDLSGQPIIKMNVLRDTKGNVLPTGKANIYLAYSAIRQDVTAFATNPGLLRYNDTVTLSTDLAPLSPANPLALGLYFALLNSPGVQVTGIGVDAVSAGSPFGTVDAFSRAATFLEAFEVYAIAPLTHDTTVGQLFNTHVTVMSSPANKGERICLFNPAKPTNKLDTLVASGLNGNSSITTNQFDTGIQNLGALLLGLGIDPTGPLSVPTGLYLAVVDSPLKYAIVGVSGSVVTVQTSGFLTGENTDGYYAATSLGGSYIEEAFAVRIRGAALLMPGTTHPDKDGIADAYAGLASTFLNRRFWSITPDQCAATIDGLEQAIDGFYMAAAIAGMIGQQPPQQSFTNFPMTGFTRVIGSSDYFTEHQLNRMAAGGNYIVVQDSIGSPLISRMALTTDLTSIETRTDSITKVVDFCAKFLRRGLKNFIGRFNITQGFLDSLGHVIQGLLGFLSETGVLIGSHLNNIIQDTTAPDTVLVDITLDVPFPCNYIRLTLVV